MVNNGNIKLFFTYIKEKPIVQFIGWLSIIIIVLILVCKGQWEQHLRDDKALIKSKDSEILRLTNSDKSKDEKIEALSTKFIDYVQAVTDRQAQEYKDNRDFLNELKKSKK